MMSGLPLDGSIHQATGYVDRKLKSSTVAANTYFMSTKTSDAGDYEWKYSNDGLMVSTDVL